jgi:peptidoglycan hydrolase-like protein with peptidoglycan-binding domain
MIMKKTISLAGSLLMLLAGVSSADDITMMAEQELDRLGYATGPVDGEETLETTIAISKFQAENNLAVTGEVSPDLVRSLMAAQPGGSAAPAAAPTAAPAPAAAPDPAALQAAQQACLQQKMADAQAAQKKKRGFGSLMRAVTNTAARYGGGSDLARQVSETSYDVYNANATAADWERAAEDLGLTEDDIAACQSPPM